MTLFTKESLERLRDKLDLLDLLSSYLDFKKQGIFYKARCPFHEEKTPSFMVKSGQKFYHCFGCGAHGDAIQFLMAHLHLSFSDSVEFLAERYHIILERTEKEERRGIDKVLLKEALKEASLFFHCYLLHTQEGEEPLHYLLKRGLSLPFLRKFEIGLSPRQNGILSKILSEKGIREDAMREAGLLKRDYNEEFFRERITFPIRDRNGFVIGFSARKFKESTYGGKYINTYETALFKKSRILFGLNYSLGQIVKEKSAYIVEGQLDCLRLIDAGFEGAVAALGTAFGEEHVTELEKLDVSKVTLLFDGDEAGEMASSKVGDLFQSRGIGVNVVTLPSGMDPDSFLRKEGAESLRRAIERSSDYLTFQIGVLAKSFDMRTPHGKNELVAHLCQQIRKWEEPVMVHESLRRVAALTQVPEEVIGVTKEFPSFYRKPQSLTPSSIDPDKILEFDLIRWLLLLGEERKEALAMVMGSLTPKHFRTPVARKIYEALLRKLEGEEEEAGCDLLSLLIEVDEKGGSEYLEEILNKKINRERYQKHLQETIQKMLDRDWLQEREKIRERMQNILLKDEERFALIQEFDRLQKERPVVPVREQSPKEVS